MRTPELRSPTPAFLLMTALLLSACRGAAAPDASGEPHAEQGDDATMVHLTPEAIAAAGIATAVVSRQEFHPHVVASGVIRPPADRSVSVRAPLAGRIVRVLVDVGDRVRAGQPLAALDSPDLSAAVSRLRAAEARLGAAAAGLARGRRLLELGAMSRAEVETREAETTAARAEADAARRDLTRLGVPSGGGASDQDGSTEAGDEERVTTLTITSPGGGAILARTVSAGLLVERDAPLFEVADLGTVWAVADVHERDLGRIAGAGEAEVHATAYSDEIFTGRVTLVEPALDEASRTAHVRIVIDNAGGRLRPGMFVSVSIPLAGEPATATAVPAAAVQRIGGMPVVFVERAPGTYEVRPLEIGREAHGMAEILQGLADGDRVVVAGAFILKSEALKATLAGDEH